MPFTIYHLHGIKVGCTSAFRQRTRQNKERYGDSISIEILEIIPTEFGEKFAGDQEIFWNWYYGYKKNCHYTNSWNKLPKNMRRENALRGLVTQFEKGMTLSQRGIGVQNFTKEQRALHGSLGMKSQIRNGTHINQRKATCPHCGKIGQMTIMKRWHFDRCKVRTVFEFEG